ncbi:hypothetical protein JIP62_14935 [Brevundimonas vitis]|uniref:asparagine synthase (glutamine-hydrolyzing) n=1 Tax=Brevundimonas vitisensis TaxID=2800818 RepID=A0ABX7BMS4_9CAUL|nr:asparagine synthase-related protein [Brevundimonas vitisensis]QQQ18557.1 hypothetical protein JIP62_14935 [Brevundimonas vitisensis]
MKNGLYALASLDGSPLDRRHVGVLFSSFPRQPDSAGSFAALASDPHPHAASRHDDGPCTDLFLGHVDEPREMRQRLGLAADASHAEIAGAAQDRWGLEAARELGGEWTLLRWNARTRTLVLLMSECRRDDCYFAVSNGQVAISPQLVRLAKLDGVDGDLDPDALVRTMGRYPLAESLGNRTFVRGVQRLMPGSQTTLRSDGGVTATLAAPVTPEVRTISFDEAVHEIEVLLRKIVRRRLADGRDAAFMLSGGLDSSLIAWIASEERGPRQCLSFLTSAAPEGSDIPDETGWASIVADHLGFPMVPVRPGPDVDVYAPTSRMLASRERPILSPRHYLYEALEQAAIERGASVLFDGGYGELTVTHLGHGHSGNTSWRRRLMRELGMRLAASHLDFRGSASSFHVCLAADLLRQNPGLGTREQEPPRRKLDATNSFGYATGWEKSAVPPTIMGDAAVRYAMPFRHRELLALFASLPAEFARHNGVPRAIGRAILRGRLPDTIVSRTSKMAFSPTYPLLLQTQAPTARERLRAQREAGAGEWLDLEWLDQALADLANGRPFNTPMLFRIQATANAAQFFGWWRDQGADS